MLERVLNGPTWIALGWCAVAAAGGSPGTLRLHGQEVNLTTSAIAAMNLYLHGLQDFEIRRGDTFRDPKFLDKGEQKFRSKKDPKPQ